jgi:hypothetical protein
VFVGLPDVGVWQAIALERTDEIQVRQILDGILEVYKTNAPSRSGRG